MSGIHALLVVDVQNDLFHGGQFSIPESELILPTLNEYISIFAASNLPIIATRDWHPIVTLHFEQYGGKWPLHCIANTSGSQFHPDLLLPANATVISKGMRPEDDSYSAFQGIDSAGRLLDEILHNNEITTLSICGLTTDYCIKYSTLHALQRGLRVCLLLDAIKGLNLLPSDSIRSIDEMIRAGADVVTKDSFKLD
jgi:nicotinamidase/pyrazinamidase